MGATTSGELKWAGTCTNVDVKGYFQMVYTCVCVRRDGKSIGVYSIAFGQSSAHEVCVIHETVSTLEPVPDAKSNVMDYSKAVNEHLRTVTNLPCCDQAAFRLAIHTNAPITLCSPKWVKCDNFVSPKVVARVSIPGNNIIGFFDDPWTPTLGGTKESPLLALPERTQLWYMFKEGRRAGDRITQIELSCCLKWTVRMYWVLQSQVPTWDQRAFDLGLFDFKDVCTGAISMIWSSKRVR